MNKARRKFLISSAGLLGTTILPNPISAAIKLTTGATDENLVALTAHEAVARMKTGELRAETYAEALLARAETGKNLNAFLTLDRDRVLEAARDMDRRRGRNQPLGALHGLPVPVKDSVFTKDYPTSAGTRALLKRVRRYDAPLIERLRQEGAIVMGKTNLHELSAGFTSNNEVFGAVRNPYDPLRIAGGSSGGTAVAVATGMAPIGIAEDTAGSIRVPASLCGIAGYRPTTGRYPNAGTVPLTPTFDQLGPQARSVKDIILFDASSTGRKTEVGVQPLQGVRIGVPRGYFYEGLAADTLVVVEDTLRKLTEAGAVPVYADVPGVSELLAQTFIPILFTETWDTMDDFFRKEGFNRGMLDVLAEAGAGTREQFEQTLAPGAPNGIPRDAYDNAVKVARPALINTIKQYFSDNRITAMLFPGTLCTAPPIGDDNETELDGRPISLFDALGHNTTLAPSCGLPALSLPAGMTRSGLPVGIEIDALPGADETLLALGLSLEKVLGIPPLAPVT